MTSLKICGITDLGDAQAAASVGARAIGIVCHAPGAARAVDVAAARAVLDGTPPDLTKVLLFVDAPVDIVRSYAELDPSAWLQFHGTEDANYCRTFERPYLKAIQPHDVGDFASECASHPAAEGIILDSGGGTGTAFDWDLVPPADRRAKPLWLAGGLDFSNIAAAIQQVQPDWIDVSSGVCVDGDPRRKDSEKLRQLHAAMNEVENATVRA